MAITLYLTVLKKGDKECSTRDSWLSNFDLDIMK